jgi:dGTPase
VAQLARGLCRETPGPFSPDEDLVVAICVAHDIGHPPLGHTGERILNRLAGGDGGFDANAQNLRVLDSLECKHVEGGLNLTRATLDGLIKVGKGGPRVYSTDVALLNWIKLGHMGVSLEAQISDWADTAAYCIADIEDASRLGILDTSKLRSIAGCISGEVCGENGSKDDQQSLLELAAEIPESQNFSKDEQASRSLKEWTSATLHFRLLRGCEIRVRDESADSIRYKYEFHIPERNRIVAAFLRRISEVLVYRRDEVIVTEIRLEAEMKKLYDSLRASLSGSTSLLNSSVTRAVCDEIAAMSDEELFQSISVLADF